MVKYNSIIKAIEYYIKCVQLPVEHEHKTSENITRRDKEDILSRVHKSAKQPKRKRKAEFINRCKQKQ